MTDDRMSAGRPSRCRRPSRSVASRPTLCRVIVTDDVTILGVDVQRSPRLLRDRTEVTHHAGLRAVLDGEVELRAHANRVEPVRHMERRESVVAGAVEGIALVRGDRLLADG